MWNYNVAPEPFLIFCFILSIFIGQLKPPKIDYYLNPIFSLNIYFLDQP